MLDGLGSPIGWVCVFDSAQRHLDEVAQRAPVIDPTPPVIPPMPEPPGGLDKLDEVLAIVKRIEARLSKL
jgi:hypothetical protein